MIQIVHKTIVLLEQYYVYPQKIKTAKKYILSNIKKGEYKGLTEEQTVLKLYKDLLHKLNDKHIIFRKVQKKKIQKINNADFIKFLKKSWITSKLLTKKIGYIKFACFPDFDKYKSILIPNVVKSFEHIKNTPIIVFDLRKTGGGSPKMVQFMQSFLFKNKTLLNEIHWRKEGTNKYDITKYYTYTKNELETISDNKDLPYLYDKKIYVLTSKRVFSAAEEFVYNLKARKIAIIVGETTAGGANPGRMHPINKKINIFIPNGFAKNPITKTNWEGKGIKPNIVVSAHKALAYVKNKHK